MPTFLQHKFSGSGAPGFTPARKGDHYTDTASGLAYLSTGTASSADWKQVSGGALNSFTTINCPSGTDPVADSATDTLNLTGTDGTIAIVGNSGTDTVDLSVIDSAVDHDALLNYVADEHIDHTSVQIATSSTSGLDGGGTIAATRNLVVSPTRATSTTPVAADEVLFGDVSDSNNVKKTTAQTLANLYSRDLERVTISASFTIDAANIATYNGKLLEVDTDAVVITIDNDVPANSNFMVVPTDTALTITVRVDPADSSTLNDVTDGSFNLIESLNAGAFVWARATAEYRIIGDIVTT